MRKFSLFLLVALMFLGSLSLSAESNKTVPPKTKLRPGLALDDRPPSIYMNQSSSEIATATPTPTNTPTSKVAQRFRILEAEQGTSFSLTEKAGMFFCGVMIVFVLMALPSLYRYTHPKKTPRAKVRKYKEEKFPTHKDNGSVVFDHESDFH